MPTKAVQQFMLGTVLGNENEARQTLAAMKAAGYDGIELCGFMIHPIGFMVRLLTKAAGMPVGKGGNLDWHALVKEAGLQVVSLHTDLGSLERDAKAVADEAKSFGTKYVVITGMYRFDYGDEATMHELAARLNKAGAALKAEGVELLYHNHNCELRHVNAEKRAYDILLEETDPQYINFEFDSYWFTEGGANALAWSILIVAKNLENSIIFRLVSTFVFNAPFNSSVWESRFSMLPYWAMSFCAVFSPTPGQPGMLSDESPISPNISMT